MALNYVLRFEEMDRHSLPMAGEKGPIWENWPTPDFRYPPGFASPPALTAGSLTNGMNSKIGWIT